MKSATMPAMALPDQPRVAARPVDTREEPSLSFGPSTGTRNGLGAREPVPVGPGRSAAGPSLSFPNGEVVHEFPLQPSKVQRPPLRRETLRRERLLDWLKVKIHHRIVLVTAEAGYGKTTLLADFARHHRRPTMWYRLDDEDRNWVSFLRYLVAAGREIEPDFAHATKGLLAELGVAPGPSRDTIIATFIRDLQGLGPRGAALIIDDYHLVDDVPDVQVVVRELVSRAPERLTIVFASRQQPSVPLARLRTLGEVAELTAADLRFDFDETERLFRDTYKRPLEPDVLADLADRTEGWAASLEMVNAALRDRSSGEVRAFVHGMTGAHGELYDYLAEEIVGDLDDETQRFLMATSLLQSVDPTLAEIVGGFSAQQVRELIARTERLGLLSTRGTARRGARRYHPLVREFLEARLRRTLGDDTARDLHRAVARQAGNSDWRLAAYHFAAADDVDDLGIVVQAAVPTIMGSGDFALAESYVQRAGAENAAFELLVSRMELHRGRTDSALTHAELAVETAMKSDDQLLVDHALLNLIAVLHITAQFETVRDVAGLLARRTSSPTLRSIAQATVAILDASEHASLGEVRTMLVGMAIEHERGAHRHYLGVTLLNIADIEIARGDAQAALAASTRAIQELAVSSAGIEIEGTRVLRGWALAQLGRWQEATAEFGLAESDDFDAVRGETLTEISEVYADLGGRSDGEAVLARARRAPFVSNSTADRQQLVAAILTLRSGDPAAAGSRLATISVDRPHGIAAFLTRFRLSQARVALAAGSPSAERDTARALHQAGQQGAQAYAGSARMLHAAVAGPRAFSEAAREVGAANPTSLSIIAEEITARLGDLDASVLEAVVAEASRIPERWRETLRETLTLDNPPRLLAAARILDRVGQPEDIAPLRRVAKTLRALPGSSTLGRGLARRLAAHVFVEDQGRVQIQVGSELIPGSTIRRKVLALLCFLLSRPNMSATRDQVLDGLWPNLEPEVAANSLNQTVYFLRRIFEPAFSDDISPGYLHHDSDVIWLDSELVESRSVQSRAAVRLAEKDPSPDNVELLSRTYQGRFALDFAYEEWSAPYRDSMHAAYLEIVERAVSADTNAGEFDRGIGLARRALEADPDAEQVELSLLRLYRRTGAHAAAAEQYSHYAAVQRNDFGIEPPPLDSL